MLSDTESEEPVQQQGEQTPTPKKRKVLLCGGTFVVKTPGEEPPPTDILGDAVHLRTCRDPMCCRCFFIEKCSKWKKRLPLVPSKWAASADVPRAHLDSSWLSDRCIADGNTALWQGAGCVVCNAMQVREDRNQDNAFASFSVKDRSSLQISSLLRHQTSRGHIANAVSYLQLGQGPTGKPASGAPPASDFRAVWDASLENGVRKGVAQVGHKQKCYRMQLCLFEAMRALDREVLGAAVCIGLQRDESHGHLILRYRACGPGLEFAQGVFGHMKSFGTGASAITDATAETVRQLCTPFHGLPADIKPKGGEFKPDQALYRHILDKIEMINVDSASDELLSATQMRQEAHAAGFAEPSAGERLLPLTPNMRFTIRDKTHATRRRSGSRVVNCPMRVARRACMRVRVRAAGDGATHAGRWAYGCACGGCAYGCASGGRARCGRQGDRAAVGCRRVPGRVAEQVPQVSELDHSTDRAQSGVQRRLRQARRGDGGPQCDRDRDREPASSQA